MYCLYVGFDYTYTHWQRGLNNFWPHKFGFKQLLGLEPMTPIRLQLPACHANHSGERERNCLFNDALNTFYLRLYGVRHMVKDHSDSEKGNPLPPHRLLLSINSKGSFICTIPQTG